MLLCCKSHTHAANIKFYKPNACSSCFKQYFPFLPSGENIHNLLIILLNPSPVLVALKILRDILSFTRSFMVNTRPLVGCLENSDEKVKQFRVIPRIASSRLAYSSSIQCPKWMCLVLQRDSQSLSRKLSRNRHYGLARMAFISSSVINLVYSYRASQTQFGCILLF